MNCNPSATEKKNMVNYLHRIENTWAMQAKGAQVQKNEQIT